MLRRGTNKEKEGVQQSQQQRVVAQVFCNDNRAKLKPLMEQINQFNGSKAWYYGYVGGSAFAGTAFFLILGSRFPAARTIGTWIGLAGGYYGGQYIHAAHGEWLKGKVVTQIDANIAETEKMRDKAGAGIPEYTQELTTLRRLRGDYAPAVELLLDGASGGQSQAKDLDGRVDDIIAAFERRKAAQLAGK